MWSAHHEAKEIRCQLETEEREARAALMESGRVVKEPGPPSRLRRVDLAPVCSKPPRRPGLRFLIWSWTKQGSPTPPWTRKPAASRARQTA